MVVRELSSELMGVIISVLPFLFYGFTFIVPVSYLVLSYTKKDRFIFG
jgi:hypothetical protein